MESERPDPDALLAELRKARSESQDGRLKIFLGMCPGVGKTYAMLLAGQVRQEEGTETIIGVVETHGRIETAAVSAGLPRVPLKSIVYRGITLEEMDLDAILDRRPELVLVDELAHSNAVGSRHLKRWQDVMELLQAGIDVFTTLNIQHIESYRDVVRQITGAPINETVPDSILERADEIELVDLTPDQLRKRLDEGKVYLGERAAAASSNFFREGNLKALREIALRITADKADRELRDFMRSRRIPGSWRTRERLLVAVSSSPFSERLIRLTRRAAVANHASWVAVHVDSGRILEASDRARLEGNLTLARSLGAEVVMTTGEKVAATLLRVAAENNVSQIVVGKPLSHSLADWIAGGSLVDQLIRESGDIDIYVVRADKAATAWRPDFSVFRKSQTFRELGLGVIVVAATTALGLLIEPLIGYSAVGLLYLLAVLLAATRLSRAPILGTAALTAFAWNFLFIPPTFTFHIRGAHDSLLFALYFIVALVLGHLHSRLRLRERIERRREQQAVALYQFSRALSSSGSFSETLHTTLDRMRETFESNFSLFLSEGDHLSPAPASGPAVSEREFAVASWAFTHNDAAGRHTNTLPESSALHLPLRVSNRTVGTLACFGRQLRPLGLEERQMLETFASQLALFVEQHRIKQETERTRLEEKGRQLQKTLLDSVSHEFKTPLAIMATATDRLRREFPSGHPLLGELRTAVARLERIVGNLLSVTRIETGSIHPRLEWYDLHEIVDAAFTRVREELGDRLVVREMTDEVSTLRVDSGLLEEILVNLLRNAALYSTPGSPITLRALRDREHVVLSVIDEGAGFPAEGSERLFEKFQRGASAKAGGLGLGLSIVSGLAEALGGSVTGQRRSDGKLGAVFRVSLPVATQPHAALKGHP